MRLEARVENNLRGLEKKGGRMMTVNEDITAVFRLSVVLHIGLAIVPFVLG